MTELLARDVEATFDYLRDPPTDDPSQPLCYYVEERSKTTMRVAPVAMMIEDGRDDPSKFTLDVQGFELVSHKTAITDFLDRERVAAEYPGEAAALIKELTGAAHAIGVGAGVRFGDERRVKFKTSDDKPAFFPHSDFTDESGMILVTHFGGDIGRYSRYAIYNHWHVFSEPPQDFPLAVCDARTVTREDEVEAEAILDLASKEEPYRSKTMVFRPNKANRWTYFSNRTVDEVLVFKGWDSDKRRPYRVPHSSFANPLARPDWPSRSSIDTRVIAFYD